jgi:hypothetical protein
MSVVRLARHQLPGPAPRTAPEERLRVQGTKHGYGGESLCRGGTFDTLHKKAYCTGPGTSKILCPNFGEWRFQALGRGVSLRNLVMLWKC